MAANYKDLIVRTYNEWGADDAPRLGAALSYYTVLSLAPLIVVCIAIAGMAFGRQAAQGALMYQIQDMVGKQGGQAIQEMVKAASERQGTGVFASILGLLTLGFSATSVVSELRSSLNKIWKVDETADGVAGLLKQKGYAFAVVLGTGFLLLVGLVISAALSALGKFFGGMLPIPEAALQWINFGLSFIVVTVLFALLYKVLPDVRIEWRDVLLGAVVTSLLFSIGKMLIGLYLGKASVGSTYGAAGSLVIVLIWVYYSAQIFFFGAEFTQVYAKARGSHAAQAKNAAQPEKSKAESEEAAAQRKEPTAAPASANLKPLPIAQLTAMGNAQLLPVAPQRVEAHSKFTLAEDLAVLVGAAAGFGVAAKKVIQGEIPAPQEPMPKRG